MTYLVTILSLSLLIILHELGHYAVARLFGMRVLRFSLGFGPALLKKRFGETEYQLAAVPLGGYVQIDGMGPKLDDEPEDERAFRNKPVWQRVAVIFAGPATNWLLAAFFIFVLAVTVGFSQASDSSTVVGELAPQGPAAEAGFAPGDRIVAIDGRSVSTWSGMAELIEAAPGRALAVEVEREGQRLTLEVVPANINGVGRLGIGAQPIIVKLGPGEAIVAGFSRTTDMTAAYAGLLWGMLVGTQEGQLSGPVGVVKMVAAQAARGMQQLFDSLAWLSVGLFLLNLLPVPALDGGRLLFLTLETVRGRPVDAKLEGTAHAVGFILLMLLIIWVSIRDLS